MTQKNKRRQFIKNILATSIGGALLAKTGFALAIKDDENPNPVIKIKPLGFQWETQDPFLFCVHHEDFFPKGISILAIHTGGLQGKEGMKQKLELQYDFQKYH